MVNWSGRMISRKYWNSQEQQIHRPYSCSPTAKSRKSPLLRILTIYWTLTKSPTYSQAMRKPKSWRKLDQLPRPRTNWSKVHPLSCTVSLLKNVKRICTLSSDSAQLVNHSGQEWECSLRSSTAVPLIGSNNGLKMLCFGLPDASWTAFKWKRLWEKNVSKWCNISTLPLRNGLNSSS